MIAVELNNDDSNSKERQKKDGKEKISTARNNLSRNSYRAENGNAAGAATTVVYMGIKR